MQPLRCKTAIENPRESVVAMQEEVRTSESGRREQLQKRSRRIRVL